MFSQLAKRSARVLPADLCTDRAHYVKNHRSTVLRKNKNMAVEGGTVSHYYIVVIRKFIDFMSLFRHSVWFSFSVKQFPFAELEYTTYSSVQLLRTAEELSYRAVFCCNRAFCSVVVVICFRIVLNFNFGFKVLTDRNKRSEML